MARSASVDPIEKFRFKVTFFNDVGNSNFFTNSSAKAFAEEGNISGGFTSVTLPKVTVNSMEYRENIEMNRVRKQPGLSSYEPVTLRRGVLDKRHEFYDWFKQIHNDVYDLKSSGEVLAAFGVVPIHGVKFRRHILISALDREGKTTRHWFLLNAWPNSYSGGDGLDSTDESKLIEEMTLVYEAFIELKGDNENEAMDDALKQADAAILAAGKAALIGAAAGVIGAFI